MSERAQKEKSLFHSSLNKINPNLKNKKDPGCEKTERDTGNLKPCRRNKKWLSFISPETIKKQTKNR
jgi:hypothetical protein